MTPYSEDDFIHIPSQRKPLTFRGVQFSRSTILRLADAKKIKLAKLRLTGGVQGRRYILRESLDAFINAQIAEQFGEASTTPN